MEPEACSSLLSPELPSSLETVLTYPIRGSTSVRVVDGILTTSECNAIVARIVDRGLTAPPFDKNVRDCTRSHTFDPEMSKIMMSRLKPYLPEVLVADDVRWRLLDFTHHWRYVKYETGGKFIPHWDGAKMMEYAMTMFTVQLYLNDGFSGGNTRFYMDYEADRKATENIPYGSQQLSASGIIPTDEVKAKQGSALIFNHAEDSVLHDGEEVLSGEKFIMRGDLLYRAFDEDIPQLLENTSGALKTWCPQTARVFGTRNYIGQTWVCECAVDALGTCGTCWHADASSLSPTRFSYHLPRPIMGKKLVLLSGKRAVGKDHITKLLESACRSEGKLVLSTSLGHINKREFASKMNLDFERLCNDRVYKEQHRISMVGHHSARDAEDPMWCIREVLKLFNSSDAKVFIVSDLRVLNDLRKFNEFRCADTELFFLRVTSSSAARSQRGWTPDEAKDSLTTETDLDRYTGWTACIDNSHNGDSIVNEWIYHTVFPRIFGT